MRNRIATTLAAGTLAATLVTPAATAQPAELNPDYTQTCQTSVKAAAGTLVPAALIAGFFAAEDYVPAIADMLENFRGTISKRELALIGTAPAALLGLIGAFFTVAAIDVCEPGMLEGSSAK